MIHWHCFALHKGFLSLRTGKFADFTQLLDTFWVLNLRKFVLYQLRMILSLSRASRKYQAKVSYDGKLENVYSRSESSFDSILPCAGVSSASFQVIKSWQHFDNIFNFGTWLALTLFITHSRRTCFKYSAKVSVYGRFTNFQSKSWRCDDTDVPCSRISCPFVQVMSRAVKILV